MKELASVSFNAFWELSTFKSGVASELEYDELFGSIFAIQQNLTFPKTVRKDSIYAFWPVVQYFPHERQSAVFAAAITPLRRLRQT